MERNEHDQPTYSLAYSSCILHFIKKDSNNKKQILKKTSKQKPQETALTLGLHLLFVCNF